MPKLVRRDRHAPRSIQPAAGGDEARHQRALQIEHVDEAEAVAVRVVVRSRELLRVAHEDARLPTDRERLMPNGA